MLHSPYQNLSTPIENTFEFKHHAELIILTATIVCFYCTIFLASGSYAKSDYNNETAVRLTTSDFPDYELPLDFATDSLVANHDMYDPRSGAGIFTGKDDLYRYHSPQDSEYVLRSGAVSEYVPRKQPPLLPHGMHAHPPNMKCPRLKEEIPGPKLVDGERSGGFNNQRQSIVLSWVIAYVTGHTLYLRDIQPSGHSPRGYDIEDIWDISKIARHVNVSRIFSPAGLTYHIAEKMYFTEKSQLSRLSCFPFIFRDSYYGNLIEVMPFILKEKKMLRRLFHAFEYNSFIEQSAKRARFQMGMQYYGIHWRLGDSPRLPLFDCKKNGFEFIEKKRSESLYDIGACKRADGQPLGMDFLLEHILDNQTMPIYVATDSPGLVRNFFERNPRFQSRSFFTFQDLFRDQILNSVQAIAVEQVLLYHSARFIPALHSSFSEWVILLRHNKRKDSERNFELWNEREEFFSQNAFVVQKFLVTRFSERTENQNS